MNLLIPEGYAGNCKGFSLTELMIVLFIMALGLLAVAPSLESVFARSDTKAATENVVQAFRIAKNTARVTNIPVTLTFSTLDAGNSAAFTFPGGTAVTTNDRVLSDISLPDNIAVTATPAVFTFSPMGTIVGFVAASTVSLTSSVDTSHNATINVVNEMGQIQFSIDGTGQAPQTPAGP